eukprot:2527545-Amphidinium_carterae.1
MAQAYMTTRGCAQAYMTRPLCRSYKQNELYEKEIKDTEAERGFKSYLEQHVAQMVDNLAVLEQPPHLGNSVPETCVVLQ